MSYLGRVTIHDGLTTAHENSGQLFLRPPPTNWKHTLQHQRYPLFHIEMIHTEKTVPSKESN
ncbi:hypothetical protein Dsin_009136 [Dipteronia sinensis]|uniref:Uncharacterized protein n=1 Tax=Dipteronia sinensis TaxID=43782 RepID=A0AAE0EBG5_9ROSI|nr:hypothetical protein Dsin_009136 [Dipteronia sinensis]